MERSQRLNAGTQDRIIIGAYSKSALDYTQQLPHRSEVADSSSEINVFRGKCHTYTENACFFSFLMKRFQNDEKVSYGTSCGEHVFIVKHMVFLQNDENRC